MEEEAAAAGDAIIVWENEAESVSAQEEKPGLNHLDTCPVCNLNLHCREPKLLPCLHSFCKKCLPSPSRTLAVNAPPHSRVDGATKPLNVIRCPVCRQECMEVDVMENIFLKDSVEAPSSTVERMIQLCMTCDDNTEAAAFCVNCVEFLCATCVEAHQRVKFTREHTIRQKEEVSREVYGVSPQRPMFCDIHKQEPLKLFCETCDLLTCRDCQLVKHKDHNYQFIEDAYVYHKQHMESMTHQLREKKKVIEDVSNSINNGILQAEENRSTVQTEIKKSICSLIFEINKKGKMLMNHLEAVTKDHEGVLRKQQEDIGYLSRHLDYVISFTKWATARNGAAALLYCKRLILFQIGNLLRAKCSTAFVPQITVRFQCRSSYWASNVDLGSLVVESPPGSQLGGFQGIPRHPGHPGQSPSGSPQGFGRRAPHNTLAELQRQVDKLNPLPHWQPQPAPPPWTWYQSVRLPRTMPEPLKRGAPSHSMPPQPGHRFMLPPPRHASPTSSLLSPGYTPQCCDARQVLPLPPVGGIALIPTFSTGSEESGRQKAEPMFLRRRSNSGGPVRAPKRNCNQSSSPPLEYRNGQPASPAYTLSQEETSGPDPWKPAEALQVPGEKAPSVKKRRRSSPGPIIVIKDEPDDDSSYTLAIQSSSLPDSTGDQPQIQNEVDTSQILQSTDEKSRSPPQPLRSQQDRSYSDVAHHIWQQRVVQHRDPLEDKVLCAVCHTGGKLLRCHKCTKLFHLSCHVPTLQKFLSGDWFCSLCRDPSSAENEIKLEVKTIKTQSDSGGGILPEDKRKCEKLLLYLFCSDLGSDFEEAEPPSAGVNNRLTTAGRMKLSAVKKRLEDQQSACYQSPADFVSDIRLVFGKLELQLEPEITVAARKLKELFERHLRIIFPDQTFPEIKLETDFPSEFMS